MDERPYSLPANSPGLTFASTDGGVHSYSYNGVYSYYGQSVTEAVAVGLSPASGCSLSVMKQFHCVCTPPQPPRTWLRHSLVFRPWERQGFDGFHCVFWEAARFQKPLRSVGEFHRALDALEKGTAPLADAFLSLVPCEAVVTQPVPEFCCAGPTTVTCPACFQPNIAPDTFGFHMSVQCRKAYAVMRAGSTIRLVCPLCAQTFGGMAFVQHAEHHLAISGYLSCGAIWWPRAAEYLTPKELPLLLATGRRVYLSVTSAALLPLHRRVSGGLEKLRQHQQQEEEDTSELFDSLWARVTDTDAFLADDMDSR